MPCRETQDCIDRITTALDNIYRDLGLSGGRPEIFLSPSDDFTRLRSAFKKDPIAFSPQEAAELDRLVNQFRQRLTMTSGETLNQALLRSNNNPTDDVTRKAEKIITDVAIIRMSLSILMQDLGKEGVYRAAQGNLASGRSP
jgi:hypothetical protein